MKMPCLLSIDLKSIGNYEDFDNTTRIVLSNHDCYVDIPIDSGMEERPSNV